MSKYRIGSPLTRAAAGVLFATLAASAGGQELITDRPDQTESAATIPRGFLQLETGALFTNDDESGVKAEILQLPGTLVRIGVTDRIELRLGWSGWSDASVRVGAVRASASGLGDADVGAKVRLRDENGRVPEMALLVGSSVPVGEKGFSSERFDPSFRLSLGHTLSERLSLGYNVGMAWETQDTAAGRSTESVAIYTVALGIGLTDRWGAFVELFGDIAASASGPPANSFDGGITLLVRDNVQLDFAGGVGLSEAAPDWFAGIGISVRFPE